MKYIYFFLGIIVFCLSCTSCDPIGQNVCGRDYSFAIPVSLSPVMDTFHIGDTIQVTMEFTAKMKDLNTGDKFDMSDFPFNTVIALIKIDESPFTDSAGMVSYEDITGNVNVIYLPNTGSDRVQVIFDKNNDTFQFSCFIVLERKGLFVLSYQSNDFFDEFNDIEFEKGCRTNSVKIFYTLEVDSTETNYELLQESPDPRIVKITREKFDRSGGFAFVVVD